MAHLDLLDAFLSSSSLDFSAQIDLHILDILVSEALCRTGTDGLIRALNMKRIRAIGFDMDYTLAQYIPETFEILCCMLVLV